MNAMRVIQRRRAGCTGKERFVSFGKASRAAHRFAQVRKAKFTAYLCPDCHGFHVGTQLSKADVGHAPDQRHGYAVFARENGGPEQLIGWSSTPDGGKAAQLIQEEPAWTLSRVTLRTRRAA